MRRIVPSELPRRALLVAGGALLAAALTGCTGSGRPGEAEQREAAERAERGPAAEELREAEQRRSADLLAHYDAALAAHPRLAGRLSPLRGTVLAHLSVLRSWPDSAPSPEDEAGGAGDAGEVGAAGPGAAPEIAAEPDAAVAALAAAEREAAQARLDALAEAPPELARLLASLAAAGAAQEYLLNPSEVA